MTHSNQIQHSDISSMILNLKLKLIDRLRATRWTPPDYWQTDNSNGRVMVICNYHWLNLASQVLIPICSTPLVQTGEHKQTHTIWPWPLTYDHDWQSQASLVDPHAKNQGQRSNGSHRRVPTDKRTDTHTHTHTDATKSIISPARQSIKVMFFINI